METKQFKRVLFGGDYNPEQWPKEVWYRDMQLLTKADINEATINVFLGHNCSLPKRSTTSQL